MEERYHATTQNRFYPDMSNVNKNITVEAKLISPPTNYNGIILWDHRHICVPSLTGTSLYGTYLWYIICNVDLSLCSEIMRRLTKMFSTFSDRLSQTVARLPFSYAMFYCYDEALRRFDPLWALIRVTANKLCPEFSENPRKIVLLTPSTDRHQTKQSSTLAAGVAQSV